MKLLQPRPLGSCADALNRTSCDAEVSRNKPVNSFVVADGSHLIFRQSCLPLALTSIASPVCHAMGLILCSRDPSKIGKRCVPGVAVKVRRLITRGPRADERFKNEHMNISLAASTKLHYSVAPDGSLRRQGAPRIGLGDFISPPALAAHFARFAAHITKVRNRIAGAAGNWSPLFDSGVCNHHCIVGANA